MCSFKSDDEFEMHFKEANQLEDKIKNVEI